MALARLLTTGAALVGLVLSSACSGGNDKSESGAVLIATSRSEPGTYNRLVAAQTAEELLTRLTHATLVRLNRVTGALEPRLAREWTASPDGLVWTMKLVEGVRFSDGAPFSSADVVFSVRALYDPKVGSPIAGSLMVDGKPLSVKAVDAHTVSVTFPAPFGPGIGVFDSLPIYPAHKLEAALNAGRFREAWGGTTPLSELAGLGPFMLREHVAGQRLTFVRNPNFWRRDPNGRQLPLLDRVDVQFVPDQNTELVRLQAGEVDVITDHVRAADIASLRKLEAEGKVRLHPAGVSISPDALWFNLKSGAPMAKDRPWMQRAELRHALSHGVDRRAFADTVYLGAAEPIYGPITPGHGEWFVPSLPRTEFQVDRAQALLKSIGLADRDGDGALEDARGQAARFTLITQKGHAERERAAAVIQESARKIGLTVDVVPLERVQLIAKFGAGDYDAIYFAISSDSFDPGRNSEFWRSSGSFHLWNPAQATPATPWEAQIDDLMLQQSRTVDQAERRRLFAAAQAIIAEHLPIIYFAAPRVMVATSARVQGATPSVLPPPVLWNAETLSVSR